MQEKINVIVVGGNHHNMLGVVRALGKKNIISNTIITCNDKYSFVSKSKYIKKYVIISENEDEILKSLNEMFVKNKRNVIITTSDFAALVIDKNYDLLKDKFILPSINNKANNIIKYMDKYEQSKLASEYKIKHAKSKKIDLNKDNLNKIVSEFSYPCILKPNISAIGSKDDITICHNEKELNLAFSKFINLNYTEVILQEYIDYDKECGLIGCIHNGNIILPGIIEKERIYPAKRGNVSYGLIKNNDNNTDILNIVSLLKHINYSGMFDIEVFNYKNNYYLNEINFRNSGNSYAYVYGNVYLVYLWVLVVSGYGIDDENIKTNKEYYFKDEILELKQLIHHNISIFDWFMALIKSKGCFLLDMIDFKPALFKFIYAIKHRL